MKNKRLVETISKLKFVPDKKYRELLEFSKYYEELVSSGFAKKRESAIGIDCSNVISNIK